MKLKTLLFLISFFAFIKAQAFVYDYKLSEVSKDRCLPGETIRITYDEETSYLEIGQEYGGVYITFADYAYSHINLGQINEPYVSTLGQRPSLVNNTFVETEESYVFIGMRSSVHGVLWFKTELIFMGQELYFNLSGVMETNKECLYERVDKRVLNKFVI